MVASLQLHFGGFPLNASVPFPGHAEGMAGDGKHRLRRQPRRLQRRSEGVLHLQCATATPLGSSGSTQTASTHGPKPRILACVAPRWQPGRARSHGLTVQGIPSRMVDRRSHRTRPLQVFLPHPRMDVSRDYGYGPAKKRRLRVRARPDAQIYVRDRETHGTVHGV